MKHIKIFEEFSGSNKWKIFAGLSGGFGGANFIKTIVGTERMAEMEARQEAIDIYDSYEGLHGLRSQSDIEEEDGVDEDEANDIYIEERENWLDYHVKLDDGTIED